MKCKHRVVYARYWVAGEWISILGDARNAHLRRCAECREYLSLGPSNDEGVEEEILAAEWGANGYASSAYGYQGWFAHYYDASPGKFGVYENGPGWKDWHAGYLSRQIWCKDDERTGFGE